MGLPGISELGIIALVVVFLFGASKLPKLGGAIGESIKNFKKGLKEANTPSLEDQQPHKEDKTQSK